MSFEKCEILGASAFDHFSLAKLQSAAGHLTDTSTFLLLVESKTDCSSSLVMCLWLSFVLLGFCGDGGFAFLFL